MYRIRSNLISFVSLLCISLSAAALNHEPFHKFDIEQDGASCKPAIPATQGVTLDRTFQLGEKAGWVHCTITQRAPHYTGIALPDVRVSEIFIKYFLPPEPSSPVPTDIGGWSTEPSKTAAKGAARSGELDITSGKGSVYGCKMEGRLEGQLVSLQADTQSLGLGEIDLRPADCRGELCRLHVRSSIHPSMIQHLLAQFVGNTRVVLDNPLGQDVFVAFIEQSP